MSPFDSVPPVFSPEAAASVSPEPMSGMNALIMDEMMKYPAMLPSRELANIEPKPGPAGETLLNERSSVPG